MKNMQTSLLPITPQAVYTWKDILYRGASVSRWSRRPLRIRKEGGGEMTRFDHIGYTPGDELCENSWVFSIISSGAACSYMVTPLSGAYFSTLIPQI